jgi:hypothetical protein
MPEPGVLVSFKDVSTAEANVYAASLADAVKDVDRAIKAERVRERGDTQDFGATLAIILGSASATAIATGISHWLARHSGVRLEIRTPAGEIIATNLDSKDAPQIAQAFVKKR